MNRSSERRECPAIVDLDSTYIEEITNLLVTTFDDDPVYRFIFQTPRARKRWLTKLVASEARIAVSYGQATGIRAEDGNQLTAVALWFLPHRRFPPPFHRSFLPSLPLLPMVVKLPTYVRFCNYYQATLSLLPPRESYLYLSGLAVRSDHRGSQQGTRLVRWGQQLARTRNCRLLLHCWSPLVTYYERFGFSSFKSRTVRGVDEEYHCLAWRPDSMDPDD